MYNWIKVKSLYFNFLMIYNPSIFRKNIWGQKINDSGIYMGIFNLYLVHTLLGYTYFHNSQWDHTRIFLSSVEFTKLQKVNKKEFIIIYNITSDTSEWGLYSCKVKIMILLIMLLCIYLKVVFLLWRDKS